MKEKKSMQAFDVTPSDLAGADGAGERISRKLRELYDTVREETIPDRFLDLLEKLDEVEQAHGRRDGGERK